MKIHPLFYSRENQLKTYDKLVKGAIRLAGADEDNRHLLVGDGGFADDVVQIFFKDYHMRKFPKECLQELRMEFADVNSEKRIIILSVTENGNLTLGIE